MALKAIYFLVLIASLINMAYFFEAAQTRKELRRIPYFYFLY